MPFRFRRSIKIAPGVRVNLGKRGASVSAGVKGAHVTVGHGKTRTTVGLPGTGISYTHVSGNPEQPAQKAPKRTRMSSGDPLIRNLILAVIGLGLLLILVALIGLFLLAK